MVGSFLEAISILEKMSERALGESEKYKVSDKEFIECWAGYQSLVRATQALQAAHEHELNEMAKFYGQEVLGDEGADDELDDGLPVDVMPIPEKKEEMNGK